VAQHRFLEGLAMWKSTKEEVKPPAPPAPAAPAFTPPKEVRPMDTPKPFDNYKADVAHIGKSVLVKGELSGSEDLYLDGEVEGSIQLRDHSLIVGPHGRVRANIQARDVVVHGKVDGNIRGTERVELKKSAVLVGDISTQRIIVEDGAFFKGAVDIQKETGKSEAKKEMAMAAAASFSPTASSSSSSSTGSGSSAQPSLVEKKY
jgi:cytoskeletal protein CcmA (bactofilin family)